MLNQEEHMEIKILRKQGMGIREIAKKLGISRNTVKKHLKAETAPSYQRSLQQSIKLEAYKSYIMERVEKAKPIKLPATVIFREIQELGYHGGLTTLRNFLRECIHHTLVKEIPVRFETLAGEQMQVDWTTLQGGKDRLLAFVAILGYSRCGYVEFSLADDLAALLSCHMRSFEYFGGVPKEILYDNMKTVVIKRDNYGKGKHGFQQGFYDFAKHYGFLPRLCRPYRAQTKGKVERFIRYLKETFYQPYITREEKDLLDIADLNYEVQKWLRQVADVRKIRELGERPIDRIATEIKSLQPLAPPYALCLPKTAIQVEQHSLSLYDMLGDAL